jgi:hypothetical protein
MPPCADGPLCHASANISKFTTPLLHGGVPAVCLAVQLQFVSHTIISVVDLHAARRTAQLHDPRVCLCPDPFGQNSNF